MTSALFKPARLSANPPWLCIFCNAPGRTKEHIWPQWLKPYLPRPDPEHYSLSATVFPNHSVPIRKKHSGDPHSRGPRVVCARCNNGWMSQLQTLAKPILIPLVTGDPIVLDRFTQQTIAAWAAMEIMTAEYFDKYKVAVSSAERNRLRLTRTVPDNWKIWIGFYKRQNWKGLWAHNVFPISREGDIVEMMDNGLPRPNTQTTTFVVGELYIHAFSSALKEMVNMIKIGPNTRGESTLAQIWPQKDSVIVWPTNPMTDRDADTVASAFLTFAQKVGPARRS